MSRILRIRQVVDRVGLSRTRVYELERLGKFPTAIQLSENAVGWLESEIEDWISERATSCRRVRDDGAKALGPQG